MSLILAKKKLIMASKPLAVAPSLIDTTLTTFGGAGADPLVFSTAGLSWSVGQRILSTFGSTSTDQVLVNIAGDVDDTDTQLQDKDTNWAVLYDSEIHVNDGTLDDNLNYDMSGAGNRRGAAILSTWGGVGAIGTPVRNQGVSSGAPVSSSFTVPNGPRNFVAIATANSQGGHDTNPPQAPAGMTLLGQGANGGNETSTSLNTTAKAYRVYLAEELSWPGGIATVPAMTWQGWDDIGSNPWQTGAYWIAAA